MKVVESYMFRPYRWGGDDPSGIDCSGMVVEGLKAVGLIGEDEDMTADGIWKRFQSKYRVTVPHIGSLAFWFNEGRAYHVAVFISDYFVLTAHRGGSKTKTFDDAMEQNAFVTIRHVRHRKTDPLYIDLFNP